MRMTCGGKMGAWWSLVIFLLFNLVYKISCQSGVGTLLNGVIYGDVSTPYTITDFLPDVNDSTVTVIQRDERIPGDFVITTNTAVYRLMTQTSQTRLVLVAGHDTEHGYATGNGTQTRFDKIYGLVQMNGKYLVSDHKNNCLRMVNKDSDLVTMTYAGECRQLGDEDGRPSAARFNGPFGLRYHLGSIYITDSYNQKIKRFNIAENLIRTIHRSENLELCDFVIGHRDDVYEFFVTAKNGVLHVLDEQETWLVGHTKTSSWNSDGQFSGAKFNDPIGIQWLDNKTLVVASAHDSQLRIIDTETWEAFSICEYSGWTTKDGDISTCKFKRPWSLWVTTDNIYIGESTERGGFRQIPYTLQDTNPSSGSTQATTDQLCDAPPYVANARFTTNGSYHVGSSVTYTCMKGFTDTTESNGRLTCVFVNNGVYWVGEEPICTLSTEMVLIAGLSSGWFLTLLILIIFIILYCNVRRQLAILKAKPLQPKTHHSQVPLPATPYDEHGYTPTGPLTRTHTYTQPTAEEYSEIPVDGYLYPEDTKPSEMEAPNKIDSQYVDMRDSY